MRDVKKTKKLKTKTKESSKKALDFDTYEFGTEDHIKLSEYKKDGLRSAARKLK